MRFNLKNIIKKRIGVELKAKLQQDQNTLPNDLAKHKDIIINGGNNEKESTKDKLKVKIKNEKDLNNKITGKDKIKSAIKNNQNLKLNKNEENKKTIVVRQKKKDETALVDPCFNNANLALEVKSAEYK